MAPFSQFVAGNRELLSALAKEPPESRFPEAWLAWYPEPMDRPAPAIRIYRAFHPAPWLHALRISRPAGANLAHREGDSGQAPKGRNYLWKGVDDSC